MEKWESYWYLVAQSNLNAFLKVFYGLLFLLWFLICFPIKVISTVCTYVFGFLAGIAKIWEILFGTITIILTVNQMWGGADNPFWYTENTVIFILQIIAVLIIVFLPSKLSVLIIMISIGLVEGIEILNVWLLDKVSNRECN